MPSIVLSFVDFIFSDSIAYSGGSFLFIKLGKCHILLLGECHYCCMSYKHRQKASDWVGLQKAELLHLYLYLLSASSFWDMFRTLSNIEVTLVRQFVGKVDQNCPIYVFYRMKHLQVSAFFLLSSCFWSQKFFEHHSDCFFEKQPLGHIESFDRLPDTLDSRVVSQFILQFAFFVQWSWWTSRLALGTAATSMCMTLFPFPNWFWFRCLACRQSQYSVFVLCVSQIVSFCWTPKFALQMALGVNFTDEKLQSLRHHPDLHHSHNYYFHNITQRLV